MELRHWPGVAMALAEVFFFPGNGARKLVGGAVLMK
jgi:hypothetical protein